MIVGSLLLILVAVGLLITGVLSSSNILIIASIVATVVAAVILIVGVRQSASGEDDDGDRDREPIAGGGRDSVVDDTRGVQQTRSHGGGEPAQMGSPVGGDTMLERRGAIPTQVRQPHDGDTSEALAAEPDTGPYEAAESVEAIDDDPPGEPPAQATTPADAARVALLTTEVLVVDGRPRYHEPGCVHLLGRESEPLPVGEAIELGFTPCSMCEPDSALLAEARGA